MTMTANTTWFLLALLLPLSSGWMPNFQLHSITSSRGMVDLSRVTATTTSTPLPFNQRSSLQPQREQRPSLMLFSTSNSRNNRPSKSSSTPKKQADFEYQELKILLDTMKREKVPSRALSIQRRREMETYVRQIIANRPSPIVLGDISKVLPQTNWRLGFSTEAATLGDLPRDATVRLEFIDDERMDYVLQFSEQTFGLKRLAAKSTYTVQEGPTDAGLVTFVYNEVTTDIFGFANLGVGFFGLLKGRANYVETAYFDGTLWLERGVSPTGVEYFNAYVRE